MFDHILLILMVLLVIMDLIRDIQYKKEFNLHML